VGEERRSAGSKKDRGRVSGEAKQDARSRIQQLAKLLGNDEIARRITDGNASRDQMLAFVTERLAVVQELQDREIQLTKRSADYPLPKGLDPRDLARPTRWHATAEAYEAAVKAICRGDLRRGQELLERAQQVERDTIEHLSRLVDTGEAWRAGQLDAGALATLVAETPVSGACGEPADLRARIDAILAVQQTVPDRATPRREADPWWTLDEGDEENPDGDSA
jgi:hypothetical protein